MFFTREKEKKLNKEIKQLTDEIESLKRIIGELRKELEENKILDKNVGWFSFGEQSPKISLKELKDVQEAILNYLKVEFEIQKKCGKLIKKTKGD